MMIEQHNRIDTARRLTARDLYVAIATSTTLVVGLSLATAAFFDGSVAHALTSALFGAAFGSLPVVVLGMGALAVLVGSSSPVGRSISRAWPVAVASAVLVSTVPGLLVALVLHLLYVTA
jgi:hypothetical protein